MAQAERKKPKTTTRRRLQRWEIAVVAGAVLLAAWGGWTWWSDGQAEARFRKLAGAGTGALSRVEQNIDTGGGHLSPGESAGYRERFPTSGRHDLRWINPGVYDTPQPAAQLVHSLEHGMIVIYVDNPPDDLMAMLDSWAGLYGGPWSGLVVVPAPGLGNAVLLAAWNRTLRLDPFESAAAAAFIDRYRGRGPEKPVR